MNPTSKVLWGEGLFLQPQHFQQQDAYHEWRLSQALHSLHPYAWGIRSVKVDPDALRAGHLRLLELQLIMPDGELYNAPTEDELPEPVPLVGSMGDAGEQVFHAAMAPLRASGSNVAPTREAADNAVRYYREQRECADQFTHAAAAHMVVLRKSVKVVAERDPRSHLVSMPLLRVRKNASGGFELDAQHVPPAISIQSSPVISLRLRQLMDVLQAKVDALYGVHREPAKNIIQFRSGDVASFWLLHTVSAAFASLMHLMRHPGLHPERLFQRLLELAGALMTFSKTFVLLDLPTYEHADPGPCFFKLDHIIRELLETVISTRYFGIALSETRRGFHQGRLDAQQISEATHLYLGVNAAMRPEELVKAVPALIKIGSPEDVENVLSCSAVPGVLPTRAEAPAAIPVRPGSYYFLLDRQGPFYKQMMQAQAISLFVPDAFPDLQLELFAINP